MCARIARIAMCSGVTAIFVSARTWSADTSVKRSVITQGFWFSGESMGVS